MAIGMAFWVLMLIWLVFGVAASWPGAPLGQYHGIVGNLLIFVLFALLGWHVFGAALHG